MIEVFSGLSKKLIFRFFQALKFVIRRLPNFLDDEYTAKLIGKKGLDIIGVVGPMASGVTVQVANLLGMFKIPQVKPIKRVTAGAHFHVAATMAESPMFTFLQNLF